MYFTYDPEVDILMIHVVDGETRKKRFTTNFRVPNGGPVLDLAEDGTVLGIEVMGAARRYGAEAMKALPIEGGQPISLAEAAEKFGVSIDSLKFAAQRGRLGARKIGRNWTTTEREVGEYLDSRQHGGPGSTIVGTPGGAGGPQYLIATDSKGKAGKMMIDFTGVGEPVEGPEREAAEQEIRDEERAQREAEEREAGELIPGTMGARVPPGYKLVRALSVSMGEDIKVTHAQLESEEAPEVESPPRQEGRRRKRSG